MQPHHHGREVQAGGCRPVEGADRERALRVHRVTRRAQAEADATREHVMTGQENGSLHDLQGGGGAMARAAEPCRERRLQVHGAQRVLDRTRASRPVLVARLLLDGGQLLAELLVHQRLLRDALEERDDGREAARDGVRPEGLAKRARPWLPRARLAHPLEHEGERAGVVDFVADIQQASQQ